MNGPRVWSAAFGVALALLFAPRPSAAQGVEGAAAGFNVQRRVYAQGSALQQTGLMVGGSGAVRLGRFSLGIGGWMGTLKGDGSAANADVKARTTFVAAHVLVAPGVQVGAQYEVRRFEANVGVTVWSMMGASIRLEPGLGVPGLQGLVDLSLLPASSVQDGPKLGMAVQTTVGVAFSPPGALRFRLGYRFERYDIQSVGTAGERYEQFRGIVAEAGLRLGR